MNMTDQRCAESNRIFEEEDKERKAYVRRYIGVPLPDAEREMVLAEYDKLIARYDLFTSVRA